MGLISTLTEIADSIRTIAKTTAKIQLTEMAELIEFGGLMQYDGGYNAGITDGYNSGYSAGKADGAAAVTLSSSVSGRTVTTKASNGKTSSGSVALGTNSGSLTFTLTTSGNGSATKSLSAGYYNAGTVTAKGSIPTPSPTVVGTYNNGGQYTASAAGIYAASYGDHDGNANWYNQKISTNGTMLKYNCVTNSGYDSNHVSFTQMAIINLAAGQYITFGNYEWSSAQVFKIF